MAKGIDFDYEAHEHVMPDGEKIEQACIDPPQSRVSTATGERRNQVLIEHQLENFKAKFGGNLNSLLNQYKDSEEAASSMIDSEFFIKKILQAPYDSELFPVYPEKRLTD